MIKIVFVSIVLSFVNPFLSFGQESQGIDKNLENLSGQYAECAAYYELLYYAMKSSNEPEAAHAYCELENRAMFYSLLLANEGRSKGMALEVTNARIEMYIEKMKQEVNNRNENISILMNKYHFVCQEAMENPSSQLTTILKGENE